jgi:hypothetical protein
MQHKAVLSIVKVSNRGMASNSKVTVISSIKDHRTTRESAISNVLHHRPLLEDSSSIHFRDTIALLLPDNSLGTVEAGVVIVNHRSSNSSSNQLG